MDQFRYHEIIVIIIVYTIKIKTYDELCYGHYGKEIRII